MQIKQLEWKDDYTLGIEDIDFQHHYFLNLINRLSDELVNSDDETYHSLLITELNAYVRFHFISEENIMMRANYPELEEHKELHEKLLNSLVPKEALFEMSSSKKEVKDIIDFLVDWFVLHAMKEDRLFADYLHGK